MEELSGEETWKFGEAGVFRESMNSAHIDYVAKIRTVEEMFVGPCLVTSLARRNIHDTSYACYQTWLNFVFFLFLFLCVCVLGVFLSLQYKLDLLENYC